jgi:N utilization substance protein B
MASRRKGRILAFQALYSWEASFPRTEISQLVDFPWLEAEKKAKLEDEIAAFSRFLITGTIENIKSVDGMIRRHLQNWDFSRLNRVDLAVLRISAYALMFQPEVAPSIVINEAIGISREFGGQESFRFINGVLDSIRRTLGESRGP